MKSLTYFECELMQVPQASALTNCRELQGHSDYDLFFPFYILFHTQFYFLINYVNSYFGWACKTQNKVFLT